MKSLFPVSDHFNFDIHLPNQWYHFLSAIVVIGFLLIGCEKEEDPSVSKIKLDDSSKTITVGIFYKSNDEYISTGKKLYFNSKTECQSYIRNAEADNHSSITHLHYFSAGSVYLNESDTIFVWTEYGPQMNQASIDHYCNNKINGIKKEISTKDYYKDNNSYLKILRID